MGRHQRGAQLTRYGERLIQLMEQIQQKAFDVLQDDRLPLDSLLAAIARFSLQTSAQSAVWHGSRQQVQQHIELRLADGVTCVQVAITERNAERLQLDSGKEVLSLARAGQ